MLPARRKAPRSGISRAPKREWPKHAKWVRGNACCVTGCKDYPIEFAHLRLGAKDNALALRPPDWFGISLCAAHHAEAHRIGEMTFQRVYAIDWLKLALEFARNSPDIAMRTAMKEAIPL